MQLKSKFLSTFHIARRNEEVIRKCYLEVLEREPDKSGLQYYLRLMRNIYHINGINKQELKTILRNSPEGKKIQLARRMDKKKPYTFTGKYGIKYSIRPNSALDNTVVSDSVLHPWLVTNIKKIINSNSTIFDVGANVGLLTLPLAKHCAPKGMTYAFEPDSQILKQLHKNINLNKLSNISVKQIALQDNPKLKQLTLNINRAVQDTGLRNDGLSTIITQNNLYTVRREVVPTSTIDKFVKQHKIANLEFIKIDTEGADYMVLRGGEKTIKTQQPIIFYEYTPSLDVLVKASLGQKSFNFVQKLGYTQFYLDTSRKKDRLIIMPQYSKGLEDGDIICFPQSKLKSYLKKIKLAVK